MKMVSKQLINVIDYSIAKYCFILVPISYHFFPHSFVIIKF